VLVAVLLVAAVLVVPLGCADLDDRAVDLAVPGLDARWLRLAGVPSRSVLVAAPAGARQAAVGTVASAGLPLVVAVHGYGGSAEQMASVTGWAAVAAERGLVVAFARGRDGSFNAAPTCCGTAAAEDVDDVGYLRDVIEQVPDFYPVDPDRVFLTGYSNGGMLTYRFLCTDAGLLAGAASVAGTNASGCAPSAPVPFLQVSGTDDTVVPVGGGDSSVDGIGPFPSVTDSVADVAAAMGCADRRAVTDGAVEQVRWSPCADGVNVGLDLVEDGTHGYPMEPDRAATPRIVEFWGL
jgi:polyhydroxybutyrate depolymerase